MARGHKNDNSLWELKQPCLVREGSLQIRLIMVSSGRLRLLGVMDALEERGEVFPLE